jgi:hypothetical protein
VFTIKIQAIKRVVFCYPVGNLTHVFIVNHKIYRCSDARADGLVFTVQFMGGMLIE